MRSALAPSTTIFDLDDPRLATLQQAIRERRVVHERYHGYNRDQTTERAIEPHYLTYSNGAWYVNGSCRLRQAMRGFRFDRIERLALRSPKTDQHPSAS